jgi:hypothetical protein
VIKPEKAEGFVDHHKVAKLAPHRQECGKNGELAVGEQEAPSVFKGRTAVEFSFMDSLCAHPKTWCLNSRASRHLRAP